MSDSYRKETSPRAARIAIWTVRHQSFLISLLRRYLWGGTFIIIFFAVAGAISLDAAIYSIFIGGILVLILFWIAVERRKTWLLNIRNQSLRREAQRAMIDFITTKRLWPSLQSRGDGNPDSAGAGMH